MSRFGHNSGADDFGELDEPSEHDGRPRKLPDAGTLNVTKNRLANLAAQKKAISEQEADLRKEFVAAGGTKKALAFIQAVERMDPDDRSDFLAEVDAYLTFLKHW